MSKPKYIELIDMYRVHQSTDTGYNPPSYEWVDNTGEIVRCKDCIHYMPYDWMFSEVRRSENIEDYLQGEIGCEWIDHHINPEGYCSYGERKDG